MVARLFGAALSPKDKKNGNVGHASDTVRLSEWLRGKRVAFVHDWLVTYRGGERVLEAMLPLAPDAPIYTLFHAPASQPPAIESRRIVTSALNRIPGANRVHRYFLPLYPWAIEQLDLSEYDVVLSTSSAVARGVVTRADAVHISYVHTPMRYVWDFANEYFAHRGLLVRAMASAALPYLRLWDEASAQRVDHYIANSEHVRHRINKRYRREAVVVHPPVQTERFSPSSEVEDYYLIVSALVPYKRIDLAIAACNASGRRLKVVGDGPELERLKALAGPSIEFVGSRSASELTAIYQRARALVFPGEEDFGITPLEAMASGRPVIAYGRGGALETVVPLSETASKPRPGRAQNKRRGRAPTGVFFAVPTVEALNAAIDEYEQNAAQFDPVALAAWAHEFRTERFVEQLSGEILRMLETSRGMQ